MRTDTYLSTDMTAHPTDMGAAAGLTPLRPVRTRIFKQFDVAFQAGQGEPAAAIERMASGRVQ